MIRNLLLISFTYFLFLVGVFSQSTLIDFEDATKNSYTSGTVTLSGHSFDMTDALIGTSASDRKNGNQSARIRAQGSITQLDNFTTGIGDVDVYHAKFGTDANSTWKLSYSTDNGSTWMQAGSDVTTSSTTLTKQTFTINQSGNVRIKIEKLSTSANSNRTNIDDITVYSYSPPCTPPSTYPTSLAVGNVTTTTLDVSWTNTNNDNIIVLAHKTSAVDADPANGTGYTSNAAFGVGSQIGTGNYVVYIGTGTNVTVTGLEEGTTYHFKAYSYDNVSNCYNTTNTTSGSGTTNVTPPCTPPGTYPTGLTTSNLAPTSMDVTWTNTAGDDIIVLAHAGAAVDADPVNGQTYFGNAAFGSGSQIGTGNYVVYIGTGTSVSVTSLTANTTYHFAAYSFNSGSKCYNTTNPATGSGMTTSPPAGDYRSKATGAWEDASTWEFSTDNGMTWQNAAQAPSSTDGTITIQNSHKVTFSASRTVDQLTINTGGELEVMTQTLTIADGTGTDLNINGTLTYTGGTITLSAGATGEVNNGGTYNYNEDNTVKAPALTWNTGSTLLVSKVGSSSSLHSSMAGQQLYNLVWNTTSQNGTVNFGGQITTINGDFSLIKGGTSNYGIRLTSGSGPSDYTMTIGGDLNISADQIFEFSNGGNNCTVILNGNLNNSGELYTHRKGTSSFKGILEVKGNINSTGIIRSSGTSVDNKIVLNGSSLQDVQIADELKPYSLGGTDILTLEINNAAGARLLSDLIFSGSSVVFTNGHIYTEGKTFVMRTGTITSTPTAYFVTASSSGTYYATGGLRQGFPTVTSSNFYPVGPSYTLYMPATVTMTDGMANDSFDVRIVPLGEHSVMPIDPDKCIQYQWEISHKNATGSANLKLQWASGTEGITFNPNVGLYIGHWKTSANKFTPIVEATYTSGDPSATSNTPFSEFSPFVIASEFIALPVQWLDIKAMRRDSRVLLQWKTASERDVKNFEVERRSADGSFTTIGTVMPQNKPEINAYSFVDERPSSGINYYRVRQVDANGQYSYSKVVQISFVDGVSFGIRNLGQQSFGFTGINGKAVMKVYDINGRLLLTKSVTNDDREFLLGFSSGSYAVTLEEGDNFYSGIFLLSR